MSTNKLHRPFLKNLDKWHTLEYNQFANQKGKHVPEYIFHGHCNWFYCEKLGAFMAMSEKDGVPDVGGYDWRLYATTLNGKITFEVGDA